MIFRELNGSQCKTYMIACKDTNKAVLIDPKKDNIDRYLAVLAYYELRLDAVIDTHTHADHHTASFLLNDLTDARVIMHRRAPNPRVTEHVEDGDTVVVGQIELQVLYTPGHTPDSISIYCGDRVFSGDVILIRGTGRTDFAGGDSGDQYDSITQKLFTLPDETLLFPGHDYRGNKQSSIGEEKKSNPRIAGRSRQEYIDLMNSLEFPLPDKIQEVLQPNQSAVEDDRITYPTLPQLNEVRQIAAEDLRRWLDSPTPPVLLDVREPSEYSGQMGHIPGSHMIPLSELVQQADALAVHKDKVVICICRAGVRSTTAAAILTGLGFEQVSNLKGGMLDWSDKGFTVVE